MIQMWNQSASVSFVLSHGVIAGQMTNGFSASVVTSGLILSAQLVHVITFAITVTLRVSSCITAISNTLTLSLLLHLRIYIMSSMWTFVFLHLMVDLLFLSFYDKE